MSLEVVRRLLANFSRWSVPQPDCTGEEGYAIWQDGWKASAKLNNGGHGEGCGRPLLTHSSTYATRACEYKLLTMQNYTVFASPCFCNLHTYVCTCVSYLRSIAVTYLAAFIDVSPEVTNVKSSSACRILLAVDAETVVGAVSRCHHNQHFVKWRMTSEDDVRRTAGPTRYMPSHCSLKTTHVQPSVVHFTGRGQSRSVVESNV